MDYIKSSNIVNDSLNFDTFGCLIAPVLTALNVIEFREKLKLSQEQFAELYSLSLNTLTSWESGIVPPDISEAKTVLKKNIFNKNSVLISRVESSYIQKAA
jgi:DNA-binding transcriptional regulator YiaG